MKTCSAGRWGYSVTKSTSTSTGLPNRPCGTFNGTACPWECGKEAVTCVGCHCSNGCSAALLWTLVLTRTIALYIWACH